MERGDSIYRAVVHLRETIDYATMQALDRLICDGVEMERISMLHGETNGHTDVAVCLTVDGLIVWRLFQTLTQLVHDQYEISHVGQWYAPFMHLGIPTTSGCTSCSGTDTIGYFGVSCLACDGTGNVRSATPLNK